MNWTMLYESGTRLELLTDRNALKKGALLLVHSVGDDSFIQTISLQVHYYSEALPTHSTDNVPEFHAEALQAIVS